MQPMVQGLPTVYRSLRRFTILGSAVYGARIGLEMAKEDNEGEVIGLAFTAALMSAVVSCPVVYGFFLLETAVKMVRFLGKVAFRP